ncbi:MAG TPA: HDOD domain-containing protein [Syntrophales bacterium]|nr:HDOD domain-containing protein [Syntrophales bacterium]
MIDRILRSVQNIPAFPETVQKVMALLRNEDYSVADVTQAIRYDQGITANILKISNSAYFGTASKVRSIQDAVICLGQKNLLRALETACSATFFRKAGGGYVSDAAELWEHSVAVALMSQILSRHIQKRDDAALYTAALLHDIGKVILGQYVRESSVRIRGLVADSGYSFLEAEEEVVGINHADLGGRIAAHWRFPDDIRDAIARHHRPDSLGDASATIPWLVYLADQACLMMGIGGGMDGLAYRGLSGTLQKFDFREKDLERSWVLLLEELKQAKELVQIL